MAIFLLAPAALRAGPCEALETRLAEEKRQLQNLQTLSDDLNQRFTEQLNADLTVQSEGLWDRLHHNEAVKIAYAKRKLGQSMAAKQQEIDGLQREYCQQCHTKQFCELCPSDARCSDEAGKEPQASAPAKTINSARQWEAGPSEPSTPLAVPPSR